MLNILYIGDVSGRVGRETVTKVLPSLKQKHKLDLVIANVENSAGGYGIRERTVREMLDAGVDLCTGGDHTFAMKEFYEELQQEISFIRPANYEVANLPGKPWEIIDLGPKGRIGVIQVLGTELFTHSTKALNPFHFLDTTLLSPEFTELDLIIVEIHAESTAEKLSLAWSVRDKATAVVGTHTHVATADNRLFGDEQGKVAYVTDIGQVGPYAASLWVDIDTAIHNFKYPMRKQHKLSEQKPYIFNSVLMKFEQKINKKYSPLSIERIDVTVE